MSIVNIRHVQQGPSLNRWMKGPLPIYCKDTNPVAISRTIREQVTCQLREEVISGSIPAGSVLRETDLATRFGVSRGPIRDAFLQLSNEGYLAYEANRGVTVRHPPNEDDRAFIADLRRQIEVYVVMRGTELLSDEALISIQDALLELQSACGQEDRASVKRSDLAFHEEILIACEGETLLPAWKQLCSRMVLSYERLDGFEQVYEEHQQIFDALKSKDLDALAQALSSNIT